MPNEALKYSSFRDLYVTYLYTCFYVLIFLMLYLWMKVALQTIISSVLLHLVYIYIYRTAQLQHDYILFM